MGLSALFNKLMGVTEYDNQALFIDVRSRQEQAQGTVAGALCIPLAELTHSIIDVAPDKDQPIVVYCASGIRSLSAKNSLHKMGYTKVANGINSKKIIRKTGRALVKPD